LSVTTEKSVLGQIPTIFANLALILIMLVGLLLLRRQGGGMFGLTPILWRQVWWRFCPAVIFSINFNSFALQGSHLAINCYSHWDPASSKSGYFVDHSLLVYLDYGVGDSCSE
jgi:hypothetical protein